MEAWIVIIFRACCWGACHFFVPGERAPTAHYGSQLSVYIGWMSLKSSSKGVLGWEDDLWEVRDQSYTASLLTWMLSSICL